MKQRFFINGQPVSRVSFTWTVWSRKGDGENWLDTADLTPTKLMKKMDNSIRFDTFVIASIGFESVGHPELCVDFQKDGAHIYVEGLAPEVIAKAEQEYKDWEATQKNTTTEKLGNIALAAPYRVCEGCGSHLDHGEACDCHGQAQAQETPESQVNKDKPLTPEELRNKALASVGITPDRFDQIVAAAHRAFDAIMEVIRKIVQAVAPFFRKLCEAMLRSYCDNPKWWHYYKHAKKARIRKKYENRIRDACVAAIIRSTHKEVQLGDLQMC